MKIFGIEIHEDASVPRGEVWFVQGPKRHDVWHADGRVAAVEEKPAKILGKIMNIELPGYTQLDVHVSTGGSE